MRAKFTVYDSSAPPYNWSKLNPKKLMDLTDQELDQCQKLADKMVREEMNELGPDKARAMVRYLFADEQRMRIMIRALIAVDFVRYVYGSDFDGSETVNLLAFEYAAARMVNGKRAKK